MKFLSSERLSPHKHKTSEGYLVCVDAILARTGSQQYRKSEVFADSDDDTIIDVDRTAEEVFSPETLASFENKPITVEHPSENVNAENYNELSVGFVRDVHRGTVDGQEVMLGTLVITDATAIEEIENGEHVELSCGYDCDIVDEVHPQQRNIRGNHVALCEQGRAGIARIVDSVSNKVIGDSVESDFEDITNMSDAKELLKRYGIDLIKKDNRNYVLRKGSKDYTFYVLDNPNEVRKDLIRAVKKLTMNDSKVKDAYVYLFAKSDMKSRDILEAKKYNLEVLGTNKFGSETNLVVKGDLNNLKRFAKEYLAYELHPDYLYKENEFAGSIVKDCETKDADKFTFKLSKKKNDYDEYVIRAYKNGKYYEDASYYTDDWDDAVGTIKSMASRQGLTVKQQGSTYVADAKVKDGYYWNDIRRLCIKHNWYTEGTNEEYDNMFEMARTGKWDAERIARDIFMHSDIHAKLSEIIAEIKKLNPHAVPNDSIKDVTFNHLSQSAKELKYELGLAKKVIGSHKSKGIRQYSSRQNQMNNEDVAEINEAINEALKYLDQGLGKESMRRLELDIERIEETMPTDTSSEEYRVLSRCVSKGKKALKIMNEYLSKQNKDSSNVNTSRKDSERKFEFSYEDNDMTHIHVVKASSLEDAINKFKRRK